MQPGRFLCVFTFNQNIIFKLGGRGNSCKLSQTIVQSILLKLLYCVIID